MMRDEVTTVSGELAIGAQALLDAAPDPSLVASLDGTIVAANDALIRLARGGRDTVVGGTLEEFASLPGDALEAAASGAGSTTVGTTALGDSLHDVRACRIGDSRLLLVSLQDRAARSRMEEELRERDERLRVALEAGRMGTWRFNLATGEQIWSTGQYEIFGLDPTGKPPSRELFLSLVHPDDVHLVEFSTEDIRPEGTHLDAEFRIIKPDGTTRWVAAHALARFGSDGRPVEIIGVNQDVTDQKRSEEALRISEDRLRQFGESSSDVLWMREAAGLQYEYLSPAFDRIYGISRQDALRGDNFEGWIDLIVPEYRDHARAHMEKLQRGERSTVEYRIRRPVDGHVRWLRNTDFPMRAADGRVVRIGGISHDLTDVKAAEEHHRVLLSELQHRVRNTLAVIRSIAHRTALGRHSVSDYAEQLEGRIDAFARVQSAVTRDPNLSVDLGTIVREEIRASAVPDNQVAIDGPTVRLQPKPAETFALTIHELTTNAIKHGALHVPEGRVRVSWALNGEPGSRQLDFRWVETGLTGLPPPSRRGFGTEMLERSLAFELGATTSLSYEPTGLVCEFTIPLGDRTLAGPAEAAPVS